MEVNIGFLGMFGGIISTQKQQPPFYTVLVTVMTVL